MQANPGDGRPLARALNHARVASMRNTLGPCTAAMAVAIGGLVLASFLAGSPSRARAADGGPAGASAQKSGPVRNVDAPGALRLLSTNRQVVVIDVRTPREFAGGHIAGATNIDFNGNGFSAALGRLDRDRTYLVHCAAGGRSTKSLAVFKKQGFRSVVHLDGGFTAWEAAGQPVAK